MQWTKLEGIQPQLCSTHSTLYRCHQLALELLTGSGPGTFRPVVLWELGSLWQAHLPLWVSGLFQVLSSLGHWEPTFNWVSHPPLPFLGVGSTQGNATEEVEITLKIPI